MCSSDLLSLGKYRAYLELKALDPAVTPDDIRDLSMREIRDLIDAYKTQDNGCNEKGAGRPDTSKGNGHHHGADSP